VSLAVNFKVEQAKQPIKVFIYLYLSTAVGSQNVVQLITLTMDNLA
jgi:hypothetical protein